MNEEILLARIDSFQKELEASSKEVQRLTALVNKKPEPVVLTLPLPPSSRTAISSVAHVAVAHTLINTEPATGANYGAFFIADRPYLVMSFVEMHAVAGNDPGAVTLQLERLQGTEAADSGDALLRTALSLKATANTPQYGDLVSTGETLLQKGDRLCLKDSGTLTSLSNLVVTVYLQQV